MTTVTATTDGSWIALATTATVTLWGPGGNGAPGSDVGPAGGGGGAGAYSTKAVTGLVIGHSYAYAVNAGANATFNSTTVVAEKGSAASGATGGAGGLAANSTGDTKRNGGNGGNGHALFAGGGGGSSAGTAAAGNNGANGGVATGGAGGAAVTGGGAGAAGGNYTVGANGGDGGDGSSPGGGGGGGGSDDGFPSSFGNAGAGNNGKITIVFTAQVAAYSPTFLDETLLYTSATAILDPAEVLNTPNGKIMITPVGANKLTGIELGLTVSAANLSNVVIKRSSDNATVLDLSTIRLDVTTGRIAIRGLFIPIPLGYQLYLSGGGDNAVITCIATFTRGQ